MSAESLRSLIVPLWLFFRKLDLRVTLCFALLCSIRISSRESKATRAMYWPTTTARRLNLSPAGLHQSSSSSSGEGSDRLRPQKIIDMARSRNGHLWAAISDDTLSIWNSRPTQVIAALVRTSHSLNEYGNNTQVQWTEDGLGLVIETDESYLLLYTIVYALERSSNIFSYTPGGPASKMRMSKESLAPSSSSIKSTFAAGPGEGTGAMSTELKGIIGAGGTQAAGEGRQVVLDIKFKLLLRIDAKLSCTATTREHLLVATKSPPAMQCIPWPDKPTDQASSRTRTSLLSRLQWMVKTPSKVDDDEEKQAEDVCIRRILYSRAMDVYVWLTSDGRAYCANLELDSRTSIWRGRCFHGAPRRRRASSSAIRRDTTFSTDPSSITSDDIESEREALFSLHSLSEDEHAVCASINAKFSLIALGLQSGLVVIYTYRAPDKAALFSHSLSVRKALRSTASYLTTGPCTTLSWTSDGHGLAVGWQNGWSVWSTYGKLMGCSLTENWQES